MGCFTAATLLRVGGSGVENEGAGFSVAAIAIPAERLREVPGRVVHDQADAFDIFAVLKAGPEVPDRESSASRVAFDREAQRWHVVLPFVGQLSDRSEEHTS